MINSFLDLHVHVAPDLFLRKYTAISLGKEIQDSCSGAVIKSHSMNTIGIAASARELGHSIYGSITLNKYVGGINVDVVKAAIAANGINYPMLIYFPTLTKNKHSGKLVQKKAHDVFNTFIPAESVSSGGRLRKDTIEVIKLASHYNIPMATGHSSKEDVWLLAEEVNKNNGRLMLTHPCHPFINFTIDEIKKIMFFPNIYVEITILMLLLGYQSLEDVILLFDSVDNERICISSDLGQEKNRTVTEGYIWLFNQLNATKIMGSMTVAQFAEKACRENPRRFLGV